MATYKDLQDRINLDYLNQMTLIPEVKRAIAVAIHTYETQRFWFNETSAPVLASAFLDVIDVPLDFLAPIRLELTINNNVLVIPRLEFDYVRSMAMNSPPSDPVYYTYFGDQLRLSSGPTDTHDGVLYYIRSLPELDSDDDFNVWTNEASNLIAHAACVELMTSVLAVRDPIKISHHRNMAAMALDDLGRRNDVRLITRLRSTYF